MTETYSCGFFPNPNCAPKIEAGATAEIHTQNVAIGGGGGGRENEISQKLGGIYLTISNISNFPKV